MFSFPLVVKFHTWRRQRGFSLLLLGNLDNSQELVNVTAESVTAYQTWDT